MYLPPLQSLPFAKNWDLVQRQRNNANRLVLIVGKFYTKSCCFADALLSLFVVKHKWPTLWFCVTLLGNTVVWRTVCPRLISSSKTWKWRDRTKLSTANIVWNSLQFLWLFRWHNVWLWRGVIYRVGVVIFLANLINCTSPGPYRGVGPSSPRSYLQGPTF